MADSGKGHEGQLYYHVLEARHLAAKDNGGTSSDPYVNVYFDNKKMMKTQIMLKNLDPKWQEKAPLVPLDPDSPINEIRFRVWDYDAFKWDEFLGEVVFKMDDIYDRVPRDHWYPLQSRKGKKDKVQGEIHVQLLYLIPGESITDTLEEFNYPLQTLMKQEKLTAFETLAKRTDEIEKPDHNGDRATHVACILNKPNCLTILLDNKADINGPTEKEGLKPIHKAATFSLACTKLLLEKGASVSSKDYNDNTPLHSAAAADNAEVLTLLLDKGADINAKNKNGDTPLHEALKNKKNKSVIKILVERGADVYLENNDKKSPAKLLTETKLVSEFNKLALMEAVGVVDENEFEPRRTLKNRVVIHGEGVNYEWKESPQFSVKPESPGQVCVIMHYADETKGAAPSELVGYMVIKSTEGKHKEQSYQQELVGFGNGSEPFFFNAEQDWHYSLVPHSKVQETSGKKFDFIVYSHAPVENHTLKPWAEQTSVKGAWKAGETAGGCKTEETFLKNPKFLLTLPKGENCEMTILLAQAKGAMDAIYKHMLQVQTHKTFVGFTFLDAKTHDIIQDDKFIMKLRNTSETYLHLTVDTQDRNQFIIVPCTHKPDEETTFELFVYSDVKLTLEPHSFA